MTLFTIMVCCIAVLLVLDAREELAERVRAEDEWHAQARRNGEAFVRRVERLVEGN